MLRAAERFYDRRLWGSQELFWRLDEVCPMNFGVHARIEGGLTEADVVAGIAAAQHRHPALRVRIETRRGHAVLAACDRQVQVSTRSAPVHELGGIYGGEGDRPFDTHRGPLARVVLVKHNHDDSTLIITFHHAIADGKSGVFVLRDVLSGAAASRSNRHAGLPPAAPGRMVSEALTLTSGWRGFAAHLLWLARFATASGIDRPLDLRDALNESRGPHGTRTLNVLPVYLEETTARALRDRAGRRGGSVHAALQAALALGLAEEVSMESAANLHFGTAVCLRKHLPPEVRDECGYWVAGLAWLERVSLDEPFWDLARRIKSSIDRAVDRDDHLHSIPYVNRLHARMGWLLDSCGLRHAYAGYLSAMSPAGVMVSSLGLRIHTEFGPFRLERAGFFANQSALGNLALMGASVGKGLSLDFVSSNPIVPLDQLRRVAARTVARIYRDGAGEEVPAELSAAALDADDPGSEPYVRTEGAEAIRTNALRNRAGRAVT